MTDLRIEPVDAADGTALRDWRHVHNLIVPPAALSLDEVRERSGRNRLENAYLGDALVGCSTVRPPEDGVATVIARVLPAFRRRGHGTALYENGLTRARALGAGTIETVVLAANTDGVRFAKARGFTETERYVLDGETDLWLTLRLA
ncbi:GNAT family N-acetyltransferase [Streptomyces sp. MBT65]|uniref:GNAT family N-acetyltransferase n=1 Tax=Streptomyces sp. MBT65 TaxID=1488395 RepID=UPI00190D6D20|nr:GNAT family N-acetyltransferase [Streptomyces sp. MBT65]MBK3579183.1 GNAT family N-acetyltransferase [Streptomyces sp. MBT65]